MEGYCLPTPKVEASRSDAATRCLEEIDLFGLCGLCARIFFFELHRLQAEDFGALAVKEGFVADFAAEQGLADR